MKQLRGSAPALAVLVSFLLGSCPNAGAQSPAHLSYDARVRTGQQWIEKKRYGEAVNEFEAALLLQPSNADAYYNLGNALRLWGDLTGAEQALLKALALQPHFPRAHFAFGLVLGDRVGDERQGLAEFQKAAAQEPSYAEAHFNIGVVYWKANELELAINSFRRAVSLKPDSVVYRFRLGQALARAGYDEDAARNLEEAIRLDPGHFQARYQFAILLRKQGDERKSAEQFAAAQRLKSSRATTAGTDQSNLAYQQGMTLLGQGRLDQAIARMTEALVEPHNERNARMALAIAHQRKGSFAAALGEFRKVIALDPGSPDAHLNYGTLLAATGDATQAEKEFRTCLEIAPSFVEAHFNLGVLFASQRRWSEAVDYLRTALELQPRHAKARWNLARVLRDSGDLTGAIAEYFRVCRLDRSLAEAHLEFGRLLLAGGRPGDAVRIWQAALQRNPTHRPLHEELTRELDRMGRAEASERQRHVFGLLAGEGYQQALHEIDAGRCQQATTLLRALLARDSTVDAVRRRLAFALFMCEDYKASAAEYRRVASADPADYDLRLSLGVALYRAHQIADARQQLEQLLRDDPDSAQVPYHLALIHWTDGDKATALELFHRARRLDPTVTIPH
ncbi:MAG TPA: tetratricopeptide repeat protein [Bryobacteraceae bacterium]|nr:tetratricopeptide repeat protein [Bryobacteraceae bacterium]